MKYLQQEENGLFIFSTVFSSLDDYLFSGDFENKRMGVLDSNAKIVIPEIYSWVKIFSESGSTIIFVAQELQTDIIDKAVATGSVPELIGDWYYADSDGNIVESTCYNDVEHFSNGLCAVKQDDKWGYIDKTGKMLITPVYDYAGLYAENGIAIVEKDGERMFIDKQGNKLFSVNE